MLKFILLALAAVWGVAFAQFPAAQNQYIGSRNLLNNPGFENGVRTSWTFSGNTSTVSAETVAPLKDKISLKAVASAQIISFRQYITTPTALGGSPAQIKFSAKNTAPNVLVCVGHNGAALSGDSNCVTLATDNIKRDYVIPTSFGASSTGFDVLSPSTTGTLVIDSVELGDRLDVSDVQQARLHGNVRTPLTVGCSWGTSSATLAAFAADADCPIATATGSVAAPATKIPGFVLKGEPGDYLISMRGAVFGLNTAAGTNRCAFAINDGATTGDFTTLGIDAIGSSSSASVYPELQFKYAKTTSSDVTIQVYGRLLSGTTCNIDPNSSPFNFDVYYYPPANKIFSTDSLGWFIDANIGGANPNLGLASVSTYTEIANAGLDLVVNTAKGSQSAKILCSGTNPPGTGTPSTCSAGSESVGISFVIPKGGQYEVCANFTHDLRIPQVSTTATSFQLVETPTNAQTILQQGEVRQQHVLISGGVGDFIQHAGQHTNCATFNFASAGEKAVRLTYEQFITTAPTISQILADRLTDAGQRDIHFTVKPAINLERINGSFAQIEDELAQIPNHNEVINGNFDFWQRGTSGTSGYIADRWAASRVGTTVSVSRQSFTIGQTDVPGNPKYFHRMAVTSVAGSGNYAFPETRLEDVTRLAGKTVTLSFYAKAAVPLSIATEFVQVFGTGGSPSAAITGIGVKSYALTTSWQKFTATATLPSVSGKTLGTNNNDYFNILFWFDCGSSFASRCGSIGQQSGTFDIAQVKLEEGINATPFVLAGGTIAGELEACQRYYEKSYNQATAPGTATAIGTASSYIGPQVLNGGLLRSYVQFAVTKRAAVVPVTYSVATGASGVIDIDGVARAATANNASQTSPFSSLVNASGVTWNNNQAVDFQWTADAEL